MTAAEPAVKTATAYYEANIGSVTSIKDFVGKYRLLSYALDAYGLGDQINATALVTKVLEGGVSNPNSLANTLSNSAWKVFATAFNFFVGDGASSASSSNAVQTTTGDYVGQQLESARDDQGARRVCHGGCRQRYVDSVLLPRGRRLKYSSAQFGSALERIGFFVIDPTHFEMCAEIVP